MTNLLAIDIKGPVNFACSVATGSRQVLRLLNGACLWFQEIAQKTSFTALGYELDVKALSTNLLKPLDNQIYIIKALGEVLDFPEKCLARVFTIEGIRHAIKTASDSFASIRCLAMFGVIVLTPYIRGLGLAKNFLGATAALLDIIIRVRDLVKLVYRPVKSEDELKKARLEWLGHMLMLVAYVCTIQLNFFGGCKTLFKDVIEPKKHMPGLLFNVWGTGASACILGNIAVEYFSPK